MSKSQLSPVLLKDLHVVESKVVEDVLKAVGGRSPGFELSKA